MKWIMIEMTNKQCREYEYYLGLRYGKKKMLKNKMKIAIMEIVAMQAREEVKKVEDKIGKIK